MSEELKWISHTGERCPVPAANDSWKCGVRFGTEK